MTNVTFHSKTKEATLLGMTVTVILIYMEVTYSYSQVLLVLVSSN